MILKIAPSILAADFTKLGEEVKAAEAAGADQIHIDVMDGRFVPNISFGVPILEAIRRITSLPLDVHLMIVEPERHIQAFADAGANSITVHVEASPHLHHTLQLLHGMHVRAGVAINPHTPPVMIGEVVNLLDVILVMTVNPGTGGQEFLKESLTRIEVLRRMVTRSGREIDIGVDGGIDATTAPDAYRAGANVMVAGTSIFGFPAGIEAGIRAIRSAAG